MIKLHIAKVISSAVTLVASSSLLLSPVYAASSTSSSSSSTQNQQHLKNIQTKGDEEINRRLTSLNSALTKINGLTKLSSSDKAYLISEINTEITGLTQLETNLNNDTTLTQAISDAQSIYSEYRVYALVLPKAWLVKTADGQQVTESDLTTLAQNLQARITADNQAGDNVSEEQTQLNSMNTEISDAQSISSSIEANVLPLTPAQYDANHSILAGDNTQLKTAASDNTTSYKDGKTITAELEAIS